jgi:glutathione synthase
MSSTNIKKDDEKLSAAIAFLFSLGACHVPSTREYGQVVHVPFSLSPRIISRESFVHAFKLANPFNLLVDRVARNPEWLLKTLKAAGEADNEFTGKLLDILEHAIEDGLQAHTSAKRGEMRQKYMLGIHRSDYMIDESSSRLLQIELNTISSSFGCLSTQIHTALHYINKRYEDNHENLEVQISESLYKIPEAIRAAYDCYVHMNSGQQRHQQQSMSSVSSSSLSSSSLSVSPIILFITQEGERNIMDQRLIEFHLSSKYNINCIRATLFDVSRWAKRGSGNFFIESLKRDTQEEIMIGSIAESSLEGNDVQQQQKEGTLYYKGFEVAVVYFRAGYTPNDYKNHTEEEWTARDVIECSNAIKCPSIGYHLAGCKKVQQALAAPNVLESFLIDRPNDAALLRSCFAGLWALDADVSESKDLVDSKGNDNDKVLADAISNPYKYVLKPQREGGGNNVYGTALSDMLKTRNKDVLAAYILMERIFPKEEQSILVRSGKAETIDKTISELGVYGVFLGNGSNEDIHSQSNNSSSNEDLSSVKTKRDGVIINDSAGYLLRTKPSESDEGGVAAGYAVLDTIALRK